MDAVAASWLGCLCVLTRFLAFGYRAVFLGTKGGTGGGGQQQRELGIWSAQAAAPHRPPPHQPLLLLARVRSQEVGVMPAALAILGAWQGRRHVVLARVPRTGPVNPEPAPWSLDGWRWEVHPRGGKGFSLLCPVVSDCLQQNVSIPFRAAAKTRFFLQLGMSQADWMGTVESRARAPPCGTVASRARVGLSLWHESRSPGQTF